MFKITNWGAEITNAKSILGGICYYRYFNENNNDITASGYFPATLGLKVGDRIWAIPSDTDSIDELYVVTAVSGGVPTVAKASYDIVDEKALRNKDTAGTGSFIDTRAGTTQYPTTEAHTDSLIIGKEARVTGGSTYAALTILGNGAYANMSYSTVLGSLAHSNGSMTTAIGCNANAGGNQATAIGYFASANSTLGIAIGSGASINSGNYSILIGSSSGLSGNYSIAMGYGTSVASDSSIAFGRSATVSQSCNYSIAIGSNAAVSTYCSYGLALGADARAASTNAVQIGGGTNISYGTLQFRDWPLINSNGKIPEERLPDSIKTASPTFPNLYDIDEDKVSEQAVLYTGATNDCYKNSQFYRGRVRYGYPRFYCGYVDTDWLDSRNDVMIDQQKFFTKLAEVTKQRIDDNDVENGLIGGSNAEMSIYLEYDADNNYYFLHFDSDSFDQAFNGTPDNITGLSFDDLADYGIYFRNFHKPEDLEGEYEFCDIYYYAPVYIDSYDWSDSPNYINYLKFLNALNNDDYGIGYVIPNYSSWSFEVDGTTYDCPIIPKTYEWNDDEYDGVDFRWEWNDGSWYQYINGEDTGYDWTTAEMYTVFGIQISSGDEENVERVGFYVRGGDQRYWEQFNPIDESKFATATAVSNLQAALNSDEQNRMFNRVQSARDLNNQTTAGQYRIEAVGCSNLPTQVAASNYFWLFVTNYGNVGAEVRQVLIADTVSMSSGGNNYDRYAPNIFVRCRLSNIWSDWKPLLTDQASPWIQGFDNTKKQILVHDANSNDIKWEDAQ